MIRSKLHNKSNKSRTSVNFQNCKKQRNNFTKVLRNAKQQYFNNLNPSCITDTKKFGKTMKPVFSHKNDPANTIILHENKRRSKDNMKVSSALNKKFTDLTKTFKSRKTPAFKKKSRKHRNT